MGEPLVWAVKNGDLDQVKSLAPTVNDSAQGAFSLFPHFFDVFSGRSEQGADQRSHGDPFRSRLRPEGRDRVPNNEKGGRECE